MGRRMLVELKVEVDLVNEDQLCERAIGHFRKGDWSHDPSGEHLADVERQMRERPDQALQTLVQPHRWVGEIPGVTFIGASVLVHDRKPDEVLDWEG